MTMISLPRLNYVELPVTDVEASRFFFAAAFGFDMTGYGPSYAAMTDPDATNIGLDGDLAQSTCAPLPVIEVPDLEHCLAEVRQAGGAVTREIFAFPGGRRFHFREPSGNELAAWQAASTDAP